MEPVYQPTRDKPRNVSQQPVTILEDLINDTMYIISNFYEILEYIKI